MPWTVSRGEMQLKSGLAALYSAPRGGEADLARLRGQVDLGLDWQSGTGRMRLDQIVRNHENSTVTPDGTFDTRKRHGPLRRGLNEAW